jgi:IS4 transposase
VRVLIELDGQLVAMDFLSNNLEWSPASIAELYRCRWDIEKFFRQIKQSLDLCDFLGNSANAVHWQIWTALLVYVLLRYLAFLSHWHHSFTRLWAITRSTLWRKINLIQLMRSYGTAAGDFRFLACPEQAYLPGLCGTASAPP